MNPPAGISPLAWWLAQIAAAALLVRWAVATLRRASPWVIGVALFAWAYLAVPSFRAAARRAWHELVPVLWSDLVTSGTRLLDGLFRLAGMRP